VPLTLLFEPLLRCAPGQELSASRAKLSRQWLRALQARPRAAPAPLSLEPLQRSAV